MLFDEVTQVSAAVAVTPGRRAKVARVAECLRQAATSADPQVVTIVVAYLRGELRQRRTGLGWATVRDVAAATEKPPAGDVPAARDIPAAPDQAVQPLTVVEVDEALQRIATTSGTGSGNRRRVMLREVLTRASAAEIAFLRGLITGELRQGAQQGVVLEAVARACGIPIDEVRRAVTLSGSIGEVAVAGLLQGRDEVRGFTVRVGRPLAPMLAGSATDLTAATSKTGPAAVEWKLDGVRIQVHRDGDDVQVFTRTLDEITSRVPEVVQAARELPVRSLVVDGEVIALHPDGRPRPFQQTAARVATRVSAAASGTDRSTSDQMTPLTVFLFDIVHRDGENLTGWTLRDRRSALEEVAGRHLVPQVVADPSDPASLQDAHRFAADALARGHEGVVVKGLDTTYAMGRRGAGWLKVKPVHTLDLVVLAAEWGHGRRAGWLSNLHLGARDPDGDFGPPGGFVMLGKTFKGLTDELLRWQTDQLSARATGPTDHWQVPVRPELVVEIAIDGVQASPRYPAGIALRFARVLRYRPDKSVVDADTVAAVRAFFGPSP
ncbi:MAG: ATP-dependent DNA ligase [Angustibacter sp.]